MSKLKLGVLLILLNVLFTSTYYTFVHYKQAPESVFPMVILVCGCVFGVSFIYSHFKP